MSAAGAIFSLTVLLAAPPPQPESPLRAVEVSVLDSRATGYGTFQSHNQKVVWCSGGIFAAHIRSRNEPYTAQTWRLSRSRDGGKTFEVVHEATHATNPPVIEADAAANVYLIRPDFIDGDAYLYRFLAARDYRDPEVSNIPRGAAGKFAMVLDAPRRRLCYFAHNNTFHLVGLDGGVERSVDLLRGGERAVLQYPLLALARDGTLHAAWTTQKRGVYLYWDIHHIASRDGGVTWSNVGSPDVTLDLPIVADDGGPAARVSLDDEFESHTWLSNLLARDGKLHFLYLAQTDPSREHFVRRDATTGEEDVRIQPDLRGERISLRGLSGFFATRSAETGSPLYCVSNAGGKIACLVSRDNGRTWSDHAVSEETFAPYSIGGAREITPDGWILGTFTDQTAASDDLERHCPVYFFRIRAERASP